VPSLRVVVGGSSPTLAGVTSAGTQVKLTRLPVAQPLPERVTGWPGLAVRGATENRNPLGPWVVDVRAAVVEVGPSVVEVGASVVEVGAFVVAVVAGGSVLGGVGVVVGGGAGEIGSTTLPRSMSEAQPTTARPAGPCRSRRGRRDRGDAAAG
jgi:hypothetical protein